MLNQIQLQVKLVKYKIVNWYFGNFKSQSLTGKESWGMPRGGGGKNVKPFLEIKIEQHAECDT